MSPLINQLRSLLAGPKKPGSGAGPVASAGGRAARAAKSAGMAAAPNLPPKPAIDPAALPMPNAPKGARDLHAPSAVQTEAGKAATQKMDDERSLALAGGPVVFKGQVLTAIDGPIKVPEESRGLCALFDTGMWLVSASHRHSPLVTSVALAARRQGFKVDEPRFVTPNIISQAYLYADKQGKLVVHDDNSVRRRIVNMLEKAVEAGANDIHIEAVNNRTRIDFRIDGALRNWETWTQREGEQVLSAIFSHSIGQSGSTANWQEPQAAMLTSEARGKEVINLPQGVISVRCQWVPLSDSGRYLDMRLQYDSAHLFGENFIMADVDLLGFSQEQLRTVQSLRAAPGGMRIFSGPVNQGKTTTLRVTLNRRMAETNMQLNCLLIEDPPEGGVIGARQIGVSASVKDEQRERTFTEIMRCALRLDPDIVMLGEIRDMQTAKFAFRLALTGRQVYTTGHVYAALATPKRLRDIGMEHYMVYDHHLVRGMICQRLLRGMCPHCRIPLAGAHLERGPMVRDVARRVRAGLAIMDAKRSRAGAAAAYLDRLSEPDLRGVYMVNLEGCPKCFRGRVGRTVCAEVIETDARLMDLLQDNRMQEAEDYWLSPHGLNGITMLWHGLEKVRRGEVSPDDAEFELGPFARERDLIEEAAGGHAVSAVNLNLEGFERWLVRFQFRSSRKHRFRIYRKLEGMLKMNEALSRSLDRLYLNASEMGSNPKRPAAVALREWFLKDRAGVTLSEAMEGWIPSGELYMIRAGEESGTLAKALGAIQAVGERARQMREAVMYAVGYPVFMIFLVSFVLYIFGVQLIENMRKTAPKNVVAAMGSVASLSDFIRDWGLAVVVLLLLLGALIAFTLPYWRGPIRARLDMVPPWSWYRILQGSGFLLGMSSLLGAQVPLKRSLEILEEQGNPWIRERISSARQEVLRGHNLGEALRIGGFNFPDPLVAIDLEILSERADVGSVIEQVTEEWIREQIDVLRTQAVIARNLGMAVVGGVIAWTMMSIFNVVGELSKAGSTNMQNF